MKKIVIFYLGILLSVMGLVSITSNSFVSGSPAHELNQTSLPSNDDSSSGPSAPSSESSCDPEEYDCPECSSGDCGDLFASGKFSSFPKNTNLVHITSNFYLQSVLSNLFRPPAA